MRFHAALLALVASAIFLAAGIVDASSPAAPIPSIEGDATMSSATMMTTKAGQTTSDLHASSNDHALHVKAEKMRGGPKIFGVGLSKTGTTSLSAAMKMLGYHSLHNDPTLVHFMHHDRQELLMPSSDSPFNLTGKYDDVDSVWDIPTAAYYRQLHSAYPDAKFILTVRSSPQVWFDSFRTYLNDYQYYQWGCAIPERIQRLHQFVYGSRNVDEIWMEAYQRHNAEVVKYFEEHSTIRNQLLIMDLTQEDDPWYELCNFLEREDGPCAQLSHPGVDGGAGEMPFPHVNTGQDHEGLDTTCPGEVFSEELGYPAINSHLSDEERALEDEKPNFAYVTLLCDPALPDQTEYIRMLLVLFENIREYDADRDVVVMVHGSILQEQWDLLVTAGLKPVQIPTVGPVMTPLFPNQPDERAATCYRSKFRALQLIAYDKILFLDGDILLKQDVSPMFHLPDFVITDDPGSPMNAGFFLAEPSQQAFADIYDIWWTHSYTPERGWMDYGPFPHWRQEGSASDWTFWCATTDQGLLFYYYDRLMNLAHIEKGTAMREIFTHFVGQNKPFLYNIEEIDGLPERYRGAAVVWYELWNQVKTKMESTYQGSQALSAGLGSTESVERSRKRIERVLGGWSWDYITDTFGIPYCGFQWPNRPCQCGFGPYGPCPEEDVTPSESPSSIPSLAPSTTPSVVPSIVSIMSLPSGSPSRQPSMRPSALPSSGPSRIPSLIPSADPTASRPPSVPPSEVPSTAPSQSPSSLPSVLPSSLPSGIPSALPSNSPSSGPSNAPSLTPSVGPTISRHPSVTPSDVPSTAPSRIPSGMPSASPSSGPSGEPSALPSNAPSSGPSNAPSSSPSIDPTISRSPSASPSHAPSITPSVMPSDIPSKSSSPRPSSGPSNYPSQSPAPSVMPSDGPSTTPTTKSTPAPTPAPTLPPTRSPTAMPSSHPSVAPTKSHSPSTMPSSQPSKLPSSAPSMTLSTTPSSLPSVQPSSSPTAECRDNNNFDPATHTFLSFGPQGVTVVLTRPFDRSAFEGATCDALREDEDLRNVIVSCCTEVTNDGGGRRLQLNNTDTTNSTIDVVFDTTIVTIGELACVDADNNSGENCQGVISDAINSDVFGDMIGGTVVDLQQISTTLPPSTSPSVLPSIVPSTSQMPSQSCKRNRREKCKWRQVTTRGVDAPGGKGSTSIAMSGNGLVAIGGPLYDVVGNNSGLVRIYRGTGTKAGADINGKAAGEEFGSSVAIAPNGGSVVAIGAPGKSLVRVYKYKWQIDDWVQLGPDIIGEAQGDRFGSSVAISSDPEITVPPLSSALRVVIGAPSSSNGYSRVYELATTADLKHTWIQIAEFIGDGVGDEFGTSVAMTQNGEWIAIGAPGHDGIHETDSGHVKVWRYDSSLLRFLFSTRVNGKRPHEKSGSFVAIATRPVMLENTIAEEKAIAIGAPDTEYSTYAKVRLYRVNDNNRWEQLGFVLEPILSSVALSHHKEDSIDTWWVATGSGANKYKCTSSGRLSIYEWSSANGEMFLHSTFIGENGEKLGDAIAMSPFGGETIFASSFGKDIVHKYDFAGECDRPEPPQNDACMRGATEVQAMTLDGTPLGPKPVASLSFDETITGFSGNDETDLDEAQCRPLFIGKVEQNMTFYGNYTSTHLVLRANETGDDIVPHEEQGFTGTVEPQGFDVMTECPVAIDTTGTLFTPMATPFCDGFGQFAWSDYLKIFKVLRKLSILYQVRDYSFLTSIPDALSTLKGICSSIIDCSNSCDKVGCFNLEATLASFLVNATTAEFQSRVADITERALDYFDEVTTSLDENPTDDIAIGADAARYAICVLRDDVGSFWNLLSEKSSKSGTSGGSMKSSKSGTSGGSMKSSKVSGNSMKSSKSGTDTGGSSF